jgi:hypothetical protein
MRIHIQDKKEKTPFKYNSRKKKASIIAAASVNKLNKTNAYTQATKKILVLSLKQLP